jgi:hypothetical protein
MTVKLSINNIKNTAFLFIRCKLYIDFIVIVCEHGLRIVICCALSNKELLLLLFEPFVSAFVHENRGVVMAMIVCSHVCLIHTHVKLVHFCFIVIPVE